MMEIESECFYRDRATGVELWVKREDLIHPLISGNKYRKLKYNLQRAATENRKMLLTFGGAYSNHIAAVARAGKEYGFNTIGVIRGDELRDAALNPTLEVAVADGMRLHFVDRDTYRKRGETDYLDKLRKLFGDFYLIPEGGTNEEAIRGTGEILLPSDERFQFICSPVGTGGTLAGLIRSSGENQQVLGFPSLKGDFLYAEICKFVQRDNWQLIGDYHFGGYGRVTVELINFMNSFRRTYNILLDPVYTAKMFFGVIDLMKNGFFPHNAKVLLIHTGGLQGIAGMNEKLQNKQLPIIETDV